MPQGSSPMWFGAVSGGVAGGLQSCTWATSGQRSLVSRCCWSCRLQAGTPAQETCYPARLQTWWAGTCRKTSFTA